MQRRFFFSFLLLLFFFSFTAWGIDFSKYKNEIMLQGFHWYSWKGKAGKNWWQVLKEKALLIKEGGITIIWFPPPSASASPEGYLPHELYNLNSKYGSLTDLKRAIKEFHRLGIRILADIVINHRVGRYNWADFKNPVWGADAVCCDDEWPGAKGAPDTGFHFNAARDIDHTKEYVRKSIEKWMLWLKNEIGFDGWRYDFVKGYAGKYVKEYNEVTKPYFSVGEFWDYLIFSDINKHRQQLCDWINSTGDSCLAFDFTTKGLLQKAIRENKYYLLKDSENRPAGLIGWWPQAAVTFVDNHDTGPSPVLRGETGQNHWPFPKDKVLVGYAYILTHPGIPCIYWTHYFDWGLKSEIDKLIRLRKKMGINSSSHVDIAVADHQKYAAYIDGKLAIKIGEGKWSPSNLVKWTLFISSKYFSIWIKK